MSRIKAGSHPGEANARNALQTIDDGKDDITELAYWKKITPESQLFFTQYIYTRDVARAAKHSGVNMQWVADNCKHTEGFQELMDYIMDRPREFAQALASESVAHNLMVMRDIVDDPEAPYQEKIRATKEIRETADKFGINAVLGGQGSTMNFITIQSFDNPGDGQTIVEG